MGSCGSKNNQQSTRNEPARVTAADEANEGVLAANDRDGDTERLSALLKANHNLVDAVRRAKFCTTAG